MSVHAQASADHKAAAATPAAFLLQAFALEDGRPLWTAVVGGSGAKLFATGYGVWAAAAEGYAG